MLTFPSIMGDDSTALRYVHVEDGKFIRDRHAPSHKFKNGDVKALRTNIKEAEAIVAEVMSIRADQKAEIEGAIDFVVGTLEDRYRIKANRRVSFREKWVRTIKAATPEPVKQAAKFLLPNSVTKRLDWQGIRFLECVELMGQCGISVDREEMTAIHQMIQTFHARAGS